jgi:hypothetical protein
VIRPPDEGIARAELDADVSEEHRHDAADQERDPDRRAGDGAGLAEEREDPRADHRTDPEERRPAHAERAPRTLGRHGPAALVGRHRRIVAQRKQLVWLDALPVQGRAGRWNPRAAP